MSGLCARLGKNENKEEFIKSQTGECTRFNEQIINSNELQDKLVNLNKEICEIFNIQNSISKLKEYLNEIKLEHEYFKKHNSFDKKNFPKIRNVNKLNSKKIMKLKVEYEELKNVNIAFRFKSQFICGIGNRKFYAQKSNDILKYYNMLFFKFKEEEIENEIEEKESRLKALGENKLESLTSVSMELLKEHLGKNYNSRTNRTIFSLNDLQNISDEFNSEYPIILSTTYSIKKSLSDDHIYDYIIMDESSQVDLVTGTLALSVAKNAVIVGDLKQLPNVITNESKNIIEEISKRYSINNSYNYLKYNFLESLKLTLKKVPQTLLREHYRCHPKIIQFCNKKFYDDQLIIMTEDKGEDDVLEVYKTSEGNHARGHFNQRQIDVINNEIIPKLCQKVDSKEIGIISPYREQSEKIQQTFGDTLKVDTIHKFQGREKDAIIITTVDNEITDFVDDPKMLNVAVTRAKKYLRLVVSGNENQQNRNIRDLIKYIEYNNFEIIESKTKSIYDLLYKQNRKERLEYLKNKKRVSDYESENLTYNLISEIINNNNYNNLDICVHVPLINVLANTNFLNEEELKYVTNTWTHLDFAIFNKMNKKIVMAVEVDGYYFHRVGTKQQERDNIKGRVLAKYDIPLIRLNTTGSGEKEIIENKLNKILK